jgi:hypothetical protein
MTAIDTAVLDEFVTFVGARKWAARLAEISRAAGCGKRAGRAVLQRHAVELALERLRRRPNRPPSEAEIRVSALAAEAVSLAAQITGAGRDRLRSAIDAGLLGSATLIPLFHLLRTGSTQRGRGFDVGYSGLAEGAPYDLLISREGSDCEIACDVVSAEDGRGVHRAAWFRLADRVDPDLQTWLEAHPGRYLLKMTLPEGLSGTLDDPPDAGALPVLHARIRAMLQAHRRSEQDAALVLRLDPLLLAGAQADELGLLSSLRREFGPEAHLSVTAKGEAVFVMAARAGRQNDVAVAIRRRMAAIAPARLTGARPGILAMFVEDTDAAEWRGIRDTLELEGEARQFLTFPEAKPVIAVTCTSRIEMFGLPRPDAAEGGEMRFRNPAHPQAKLAALAPAVLSSV